MAIKQVKHFSEINDKIINAVDTITNPVKQTMGPRGGNVIFENDAGEVTVTNDGVTIARNIAVADPFEDAIIQIIKEAALKTNGQAGDGTSTTCLWSSILIKEGLKLVEEGMNQRDVTDAYRDFVQSMHRELEKLKKKVVTDDELLAVARISANNDSEIAEKVVEVVRTAGEDGFIFLEPSNTKDTEVVIDSGFVIHSGLLQAELINTQEGSANYDEIPVLITDKQLYYAQEAETILNTVLKNGYKEVLIVAKDFVGEALPYFLANHQRGSVRCLLVKDPNIGQLGTVTLEDLASYLNGEVVTETQGKIVDRLEIDNFCMAKRAYSDAGQTVIMRYEKESDKRLKERIKGVKQALKKHGDDENAEQKMLKKRLASLTNGIVTVRIGGSTPIEVKERRFRYEDAISAGRAAVKDGVLLGGGTSVLKAFAKATDLHGSEYSRIFQKVAEANLRQIAENAGAHADSVVSEVRVTSDNHGYDALTDTFVDMKKAGILDPFKVTKMAVENAVSIATAIIGSRYLIVNDNGETRKEGED